MQLPLKLELHDGRAVFIQPTHVTHVLADQFKGLTKVTFVGDKTLQVKGDAEDIAERIWPLPTDGR